MGVALFLSFFQGWMGEPFGFPGGYGVSIENISLPASRRWGFFCWADLWAYLSWPCWSGSAVADRFGGGLAGGHAWGADLDLRVGLWKIAWRMLRQ